MALTSDQITAQNFKDFYQMILPYLNNGSVVYSLDEVKTNKVWINGKPIYRKTYSGLSIQTTQNTWTTVASVSGMNIEKLTDASFTSSQNNSAVINQLVQINGTNLQIYTSGFGALIDTLTVEYTKTTD